MKNKRVPEIRIGGFSEEWEHRELGEISEKITEKNKDNIYSETLTNSAEFGIITQRDFFEKDISNKKNLDGYYVVHPDYFVYNPRISSFAPVGPIKRNKLGRTGIMSPLYYVFRTHDVDKTYLEYYFSGNRWHRFMKLNGDTGARSDRFAIKDSVFRQMPIPIPSTEEQMEIGNFFTELEETITICQQELDTLKQTKQGFLQKMFPKKGEPVPEIRFPGFTGDWKQRKLGELGKIRSGIGFPVSEQGGNEGIPFYKISDMTEIGNEREMKVSNNYVSDNQLQRNRWRPIEDVPSVIFAKVGAALMLNRKRLVRHPFLIDNNTMSYSFDNNWSIDFGFALFETLFLPKYAQVGALPSFNASDIESIKINIPEKEEQTKIGNLFKQLDEKIALHEQELEILKQTKKAFLQKIFV